MNKNDSTISLIKSIRPIDYSYSKQARNYERFFHSLSLKNLLKNLNKKIKVANKFELPILKEPTKINNDIVNVKIKSNFNYLTELSSLKNFQVSSMKKKKITQEDIDKMKLFKELFYVTKEKIVDMEFRKKRFEKIKEKYLELKSSGEKEFTLDPGKYFPKYDLLYRRNPVVYIGKRKLHESKTDDKLKKENLFNAKLNRNNSADELKLNLTKNKKKKSVFKIRNRKESKEKDNIININDIKNIKISFGNINVVPLSQTMYNVRKYSSDDGFLKIERIHSFKISKKTSTSMNFYTSSKKRLLKKSATVSNYNNIKCPILFNRMPGRDRKIAISNDYKEVDYKPNYDITRPHVPATLFKNSFDYTKFKKYITGKIIRSYCYSPDKYFVLEINKNMENDKDTKLSKKRNKTNKDKNIINYN